MMKSIFTFSLFLLGSLPLWAQLSILVVDDSADEFENTSFITLAVDSAGYEYDLYDAAAEGLPPSYELMSGYDLLIWHTSTDGVGLSLWAGMDEDNDALKLYLEEGGSLWLIGNDFLFDRYGVPPATFEPGSFPYDYLGISSYDAQAYGSDGGIGVSAAQLAENGPIAGLSSLSWQFETLWWPDAVTPADGAQAIYTMGGGAGYPLEGMPMATFYDNGTFKTLSYFFDLFFVEDFTMAKLHMQAVLGFFASGISSTNAAVAGATFGFGPNPVNGQMAIKMEVERPGIFEVSLLDQLGRKVAAPVAATRLSAGVYHWGYDAAHLPAGLYFLRLSGAEGQQTAPVILAR
ncbi:T9SS type A sorting domain-containing protein [Phaeodactylibacter luteus]|uniref:T9SS type A sorting domain-containing protein n=1 Tax=Phaeodactylibacter luteus TaxID=1564516 RepID=A0A5C6RSX4_9BACT|nr:T9SS type A sorting domain-containing protein [Phaeodactylibacter luteus]TXB65546.1 T9SS type A sorting domain-containing protein [Phaeodactylibacter luteus]